VSSPARSSEAARERILYLVTNDISARFLRGQLGFLIDHGFDVHVGSRLSDPPAEFDAGVVAHDLQYMRQPSPIHDVRALWSTIRLMRRVRPSIVNASTPKAGLLGMLASWWCRVPQRVYVVRGLRFETMTGARRQMFRWIERLTSACATHVVFNSRSLLELAEREHAVAPGAGIVLGAGSGNGIDPARFDDLPTRSDARRRLGIAVDLPVIGFVGRLTRDKGIVDLVDSVTAASDHLVLLIVGDYERGDPVPDRTRNAIERDPRIVRLPWTDDTRDTYAAIDVLAFPSYREGLPNVPLEAQLCGTPVVAYAATGTVDAVTDGRTGVLVPTGHAQALWDAARDLLRRPEAGAALGRAGCEWVRAEFDRERVWRELAEVYGLSPRR
jgi:glycosyltransferase involved in cell wall biosynthesis